MKPAPFEYRRPETVDEALALLAAHGDEAKVLAGGQSLVPVMNFRLAQPALLVDVNRLADLDFVRPTADGGLAIGALTRQRRLEREAVVAERHPLLAEAVPWVAHPQIRNRGTVGGTLAHADPAAELPAVAVALDATVKARSVRGERELLAEELFLGLFATALAPDELLVEVSLPPLAPGAGCAFSEVARRHGDYALVGLAAVVTLDDAGICRDARLVFLSVGDVPLAAPRAADVLVGERLGDELLAAAADAATREVAPRDDIHASAEFKRHLTAVLTRRVVATAWERAAA